MFFPDLTAHLPGVPCVPVAGSMEELHHIGEAAYDTNIQSYIERHKWQEKQKFPAADIQLLPEGRLGHAELSEVGAHIQNPVYQEQEGEHAQVKQKHLETIDPPFEVQHQIEEDIFPGAQEVCKPEWLSWIKQVFVFSHAEPHH